MTRRKVRRVLGAVGFTLIELMIVVVIVAILALVLLPMLIGHTKVSRMSEGVAGVGAIRTALRCYASGHGGQYPTLTGALGNQLGIIAVTADELNGKFLQATDYVVTSTPSAYTIRATLPTDTDYWYQVDTDGVETKGAM
jgi:prepilin-type N-terminal cleavage/methylation domain-containing protein